MPKIYDMYVMAQAQPEGELVAGITYFTSWAPWRSYRVLSAIHVLRVGEIRATYQRQKYRMWGNFYRLEEDYISGTIEDRKEYLTKFFSHPGYKVIRLKNNKCMFKTSDANYIIGKIANVNSKVHALELGVGTMWNGKDYTLARYFCSGTEMSGLTEAMLSHDSDSVTMGLDTLKNQDAIITCKNCLKKL